MKPATDFTEFRNVQLLFHSLTWESSTRAYSEIDIDAAAAATTEAATQSDDSRKRETTVGVD